MRPKSVSYKLIIATILVIYVAGVLAILSAGSSAAGNPHTTLFKELGGAFGRIGEYGLDAFIPYNPEATSIIGIYTLFTLLIGTYYAFSQRGKEREIPGDEQGSAGWNTDIKSYNMKYTYPYGDKNTSYEENAIISNDVFLGYDGYKTDRNLNTIVVGGSGSGKSRFYIKPSLLQADSREGKGTSYVITDPAGDLLKSTGKFLEKQGYKVRVLNLSNMEYSSCYNPFDYINTEEDVLILINCLIKNTTPEGKSGGDPFWEKSESALLSALFFFLWKHRTEEERNFTSVMKLLRAANIDENDSSTESPLDQIFKEIGEKDPNDMGYKSYQTFRMGAGKTLKSILISAAVRLNSFEIPAVAKLVSHDFKHPEKNLDLRKVGMEKTALFCIIPSADDTYNFIVAMMYYQLFATLYYSFDHDKIPLKYPVRFLLDEFANIGTIPGFDVKLATMRKYRISCSIVLQNLKQLEEMYDKKAEPIIGNCDTMLFLGSSETSTLKTISEKLGYTTVKGKNYSKSRGTTGSSSESTNATKRELMTPDEIGRMKTSDCIVFVRGEKPFLGPKYKYQNHPNYKYTEDADKANEYNIIKEFDKITSGETVKKDDDMPTVSIEGKPKKVPFVLFEKGKLESIKEFFKREKGKSNDSDEEEIIQELEEIEEFEDELEEEAFEMDPAMLEDEFSDSYDTEDLEEIADEDAEDEEESSNAIKEPTESVLDDGPVVSSYVDIDDSEDFYDNKEDEEIETSKEVEAESSNIEETAKEEKVIPKKEEPYNPFAAAMKSQEESKEERDPELPEYLHGNIEEDNENDEKVVNNINSHEKAKILSSKEINELKDAFDEEEASSTKWEI